MISKCPLDTTLVHVLLHLLLIKEGYLGWLENDALWQGKEACKLETPFHSIPVNFCTQQNRNKRACEPSTEGQYICADSGFFPRKKMLENYFFCLSFELPVRLAFFHIPVCDQPFLSTALKTLSRFSQTEQQSDSA